MLFTICYATTKAMINKPHDGCKKRCHRLGFVSVLTHGPQLDIDVLTVYNAFARLVHHIITIQKYLVGLISDILIILLKLTIHLFFILFFLTCRCARHGVTAYMQQRLCSSPIGGRFVTWQATEMCQSPLFCLNSLTLRAMCGLIDWLVFNANFSNIVTNGFYP